MLGRSQAPFLHSVVFAILAVCLNCSCSMYCGTNIAFGEESEYRVSFRSDLHLQYFSEVSQRVTFTFNFTAIVIQSTLNVSLERYEYQAINRPKGILHILTIKKVEKRDSGRYFCYTDSNSEQTKQLNLRVVHITKERGRCMVSNKLVSWNNDSGTPVYQFNCSTLYFSRPNIDQRVDEQGIGSSGGNFGGRSLVLSSSLVNFSNLSSFQCNFTEHTYSQCIHEGFCSNSPSTVSNYLGTYATSSVYTAYEQRGTTSLNETTQSDIHKSNKLMIAVGSFLVTAVLLIFIGAKMIHQKVLLANSTNKKDSDRVTQLNNVVDEQLEGLEVATRSRNNNIPQNAIDRSTGNEASSEGIVMVKNAIYDSCKVDLLTGVSMVKNYIYESAEEATKCEVESHMYSSIQRM